MPLENSYKLSKKENKDYFINEILPELEIFYSIEKSSNPTAYFTAGIPGAGKSLIVKEWRSKNPGIPVIDMDDLRKYHPYIDEIQQKYHKSMAEITNEDVYLWAMAFRKEVIKKQSDFIFDSSLRNANNVEHYISGDENGILKYGYTVKVKMVAAHKYEALQGAFKRYAKMYQIDPNEARYVKPEFIKKSAIDIIGTAKKLEELAVESKIKEFHIVTREYKTIYSSHNREKEANEVLKDYYSFKNYWDRSKIELLKQNWSKTVISLKIAKVPQSVLNEAIEIKKEVDEALSSLF